MRGLHIAASPLTGTIFTGKLLSSGLWAANKTDLTIEALVAVAEHTIHFGEAVVVSEADGTPKYKITVEVLGK